MLDIVRNQATLTFPLPLEREAEEDSSELALLSRQTRALEYIASQLGQLASRALEMQPDYELATRRLLLEAV